MDANKGYMVRFLNGNDKKFVIPVYQRAYSWKKGDCELLLSDLESVYEKGSHTHFFGSIVYVANNLAGYTEYIIIDGQLLFSTLNDASLFTLKGTICA